MKKIVMAGLVGALLGAGVEVSPGPLAATITVTNANDGGPGSLRDAIALASRGDEIQFAATLAGVPIVLTGGELLIEKDLVITGLGPDETILDGNQSSRVIQIAASVVATISMITIRNGSPQEAVPTPYGDGVIAEGGGVYNRGTLRMNDVVIRDNSATFRICDALEYCVYQVTVSVKGGGVFNSGNLLLDRCSIERNQADGRDSFGGGIYNSGQVAMSDTTVSGNFGYAEDRAHGLQGVGIFNDASGTMSVVQGTVTDNSIGASQAIHNLGTLSMTGTIVAGNGFWRGGGLNNQGTATLRDSMVIANWSGAGGQQYGFAGGITNRGTLTLVQSTVSNNEGLGTGGIVNDAGTLRIANSTISNNRGNFGAGGLGYGYLGSGVSTAISSTIASNRRLGIIAASDGKVTLKNSIVAGNYSDESWPIGDCSGSITSLGGNILGDGSGCRLAGDALGGDTIGVDWTQTIENEDRNGLRVSRLADNGGPTYTVALLPDSPAIDLVPVSACTDDQGNPVTTDQRGVSRPQGVGCDAGAFELSQPRGAGFWAHQCSSDGFHQIDAADLQALFTSVADASSVFPECAAIGCDALVPQRPQNDLRARAAQELLALRLNLTTGRLTLGRPVDLPDLTSARSVSEALSQIELTICDPKATRGDLGNVKALAETLNGGLDDMELEALHPPATAPAGSTVTIALDLVNMSPDSRNYELSAAAPWPVKLSSTRINALGSGQTAQPTVVVTVPSDAKGTTVLIRITARDLLSQVALSREIGIVLQASGAAPTASSVKRR